MLFKSLKKRSKGLPILCLGEGGLWNWGQTGLILCLVEGGRLMELRIGAHMVLEGLIRPLSATYKAHKGPGPHMSSQGTFKNHLNFHLEDFSFFV